MKRNPSKYGYEWGGSQITEQDWEFISKIIKENNISKVLTYGGGLCSLLLSECVKTTCYDKNSEMDKLVEYDIELKSDYPYLGDYDMIFINGPVGSDREISFRSTSVIKPEHIIVHDASRENEKLLQTKYLNGYQNITNGGTRCRLWSKKKVTNSKPCDIRLISTARGWGGCARSITTIMKRLLDLGYNVELVPFHYKNHVQDGIGGEFRKCLNNELKDVIVRNYDAITERCKITFVYSDDYVWEFKRPDLQELFSNLNCDRKVLAVNYRIGPVGTAPWTKDWDNYLFLNSEHESTLKSRVPGAKTQVLAPCVDLSKFFKAKPIFDKLKLIRHSSQGDLKFIKDDGKEILELLNSRKDMEMHLMPGPSYIDKVPRITKYPKNTPPVDEFLSLGNLFYYSLPPGFVDAGPRVILEAMAAGLPVIADNWGGAKDRIVEGTGWLCNSKEEYINIIKDITVEELKVMGENARKHAMENFVPENWIKEILG